MQALLQTTVRQAIRKTSNNYAIHALYQNVSTISSADIIKNCKEHTMWSWSAQNVII